MIRIRNVTRREILAEKVRLAKGFIGRLVGLLGSRPLENAEACLISSCRSVHTFGMRYPIDVYFLNAECEVIGIAENLKPNRVSSIYWQARSVLEFSSAFKRDCRLGDRLYLEARDGETC